MVFMLTPELFPSYARAIGCGLVGVFDNLSLSLSVKMIPTFLDSIGVGGMFLMYTLFTLVALVFSYFLLPETYGLSLEDIEKMWRGSQKSEAKTLQLPTKGVKNSLNGLRSNSILSIYETSNQYTR